MPEITSLWNLWYFDKKKIVPSNLVIDPAILSVWFMDDGSMCGDSDVYLNTQQFNKRCQSLLIEKLRGIGLKSGTNRDKKYYRIRFLKSSIPLLKNIVEPNIVPSMIYKIGL